MTIALLCSKLAWISLQANANPKQDLFTGVLFTGSATIFIRDTTLQFILNHCCGGWPLNLLLQGWSLSGVLPHSSLWTCCYRAGLYQGFCHSSFSTCCYRAGLYQGFCHTVHSQPVVTGLVFIRGVLPHSSFSTCCYRAGLYQGFCHTVHCEPVVTGPVLIRGSATQFILNLLLQGWSLSWTLAYNSSRNCPSWNSEQTWGSISSQSESRVLDSPSLHSIWWAFLRWTVRHLAWEKSMLQAGHM